jgi:REP element-mobilizing transposase RayT
MPAPRGRFYRRDLPHLQREGKPHFCTFVTHGRWELPEAVRSIVLQACVHEHERSCCLHAAVVMPEHVHLIITPWLDDGRSRVWALEEILRRIKSASAHLVNRQLGRKGRVWQEESFDHVLREESFDHVLRASEKLDAAVEYVALNPVRRGLVQSPARYPWLWVAPLVNPFVPPAP